MLRPIGLEKGPVAQWIRHLTTNQGIPGWSYLYDIKFMDILIL